MCNTKIGDNVVIRKAIIGKKATIRRNSVIGNSEDVAVLGDNEDVKSNSIIK